MIKELEEIKEKYKSDKGLMRRITIIENLLKEYEGIKDLFIKQCGETEKAKLECYKKDRALELLKDIFDINIDLRDETQSSFIMAKCMLNTLDYNKAKLLKEVLL